MSYRRPDSGNSMNDYFSALADFSVLSRRLLSADSQQKFLVWLDKLRLIDKRALFLFLRKNKESIKPEYMALAQRIFKEKI